MIDDDDGEESEPRAFYPAASDPSAAHLAEPVAPAADSPPPHAGTPADAAPGWPELRSVDARPVDAALAERVLPRLVRRAEAEEADRPAVAEVLPGVSVVIVDTAPDRQTAPVDDLTLLRMGGLATALAHARANLRQLPPPGISDLVADTDRDDATVHVLLFDDFFGASRVLNLPELLAGMGVESPTYGILLAVPTRQVVLVHVVRGAGVIRAGRLLAHKSSQFYDEGPAPLSPHVYYQRGAEPGEQVTTLTGGGALEYEITDALRQCLGELGLLERGP